MMKKVGLFIICLFMVFFVSGCDKNDTKSNIKTLTCSGTNTGTNMNAESVVKYTFENKKLSKSNIEVVFKDIDLDNLSSIWDNLKEQFTEQNKPTEEVGYKRTVKSDDKKYTFTVYIDIDFNKISEETMDKYEIEDYREKTYDEIKKESKSLSLTCK